MSGISWLVGAPLASWIVLCSFELVFDCHIYWNCVYRYRDSSLVLCLQIVTRNFINYELWNFLLLFRVLEHINYYKLPVLISCYFLDSVYLILCNFLFTYCYAAGQYDVLRVFFRAYRRTYIVGSCIYYTFIFPHGGLAPRIFREYFVFFSLVFNPFAAHLLPGWTLRTLHLANIP